MAKSSRKLKLDMTGVESYTRCPEGEQIARVKKLDMGTVQGSGDDALKAVFEVTKGEGKGCQVFETFSLGEKALWKLKQFLTAIGVKADGKMSIDLDKLEGKLCILDVIHEEYNGQKRAKISAYLKLTDDSDEDEDDEDEDDEDDEDEEEVKPSKPEKTPAKKAKKPADDEDDDEDDDEEDEPPAKSKKGSKSAKAAPAKKTSKKAAPVVEDEDEDDDDDWDEDDDD